MVVTGLPYKEQHQHMFSCYIQKLLIYKYGQPKTNNISSILSLSSSLFYFASNFSLKSSYIFLFKFLRSLSDNSRVNTN
ncbi:hypothetical protein YC2023_105218 [Brassica napus]